MQTEAKHIATASTQFLSTTTRSKNMPGHKIPEPYCWDESFATFYAQIDDEHKGLFDGIFKCAGSPSDAGALGALATAVKTHFANEEAKMQANNYAEFDAHKPLHVAFLKTLDSLSVPLSTANIDYAKQWLVDHIKDTDFKYKGILPK